MASRTGPKYGEQQALFDIAQIPDAAQARANHLAEWWLERAREDIRYMVPKAIAYGSADLQVMGEAMLTLMPQCRGKVDGQELAISFYLLGKVARLFGAYVQGEKPSDDTWHDAHIYARMAEHVREFGQW